MSRLPDLGVSVAWVDPVRAPTATSINPSPIRDEYPSDFQLHQSWRHPLPGFSRLSLSNSISGKALRFRLRRLFRPGFQNYIWVFDLPTLQAVTGLDARIVYQCVDLPGGWGTARSLGTDLRATVGASWILATSVPLASMLAASGPPVSLALNCVDSVRFAPTGPKVPSGRIGYVGAIGALKVDFGSLSALASRIPNLSVMLYGPILADAATGVAQLRTHPNVHLGPSLPYVDVPRVMQSLDVGLLPSPRNSYAGHSVPLKALEYVACGLPVVASDILPIRHLGETIRTYRTAEDLVQAIDKALSSDWPSLARAAQVVRARYSWERRAEQIAAVLCSESSWGRREDTDL